MCHLSTTPVAQHLGVAAAYAMLRVTPLLLLASGFAPRHAPSTRHGVRRRVGPAADEWPELTNVPLPAKLAGGLFLFAASVPRRDRALAEPPLTAPASGELLAGAPEARATATGRATRMYTYDAYRA